MEMMALKGERRERVGTRAARGLRAEGRLPAVIYGHGERPETISLELHDVEVGLQHGVRTFEVDLGGKTDHYLIKEVQYNHLDSTPIHLDLTRVDMDERVTVEVGIELRGTPKGASEGGVLDQHLVQVEVECLVSKIPDTLHPFVTDLDIGDSLLSGDLELPEGVTLVTDPEEKICTLREPTVRPEVEAEEGEVEEEDVAEPERIGRVRKDEDEEGSQEG